MATFKKIQTAIIKRRFAPPKPKEFPTVMDYEAIRTLEKKGQLMIMRKDDGHGHVVIIDKSGIVSVYTLGLHNVTEKYTHIVEELQALKFPPQTILCSEFTRTINGIQDRIEMQRITSSALKNAKKVFETSGVYAVMSIFNVLVWNGRNVCKKSNYDRYHLAAQHIKDTEANYVRMVEMLRMSLDEARIISENNKWEGLVLYDPHAATHWAISNNDELPSFPRPDGIWKDKKYLEVDFVAYDFVPSTAKTRQGCVKDFHLGLIDPATKEIIPCGKCGIGLKVAQLREYFSPGALPIVLEVRFEGWTKKGKTNLAKILRVRDDKHHAQCLAPKELLEDGILSKKRIQSPWFKEVEKVESPYIMNQVLESVPAE